MPTILIVADRRVPLKTLKRGLRVRGYGVAEASSGAAALRYLSGQSRVDLVLTDYALPYMAGDELARGIRQRWGSLPVIIMVAGSNEVLGCEALLTRGVHFIDKPFDINALEKTIRSHLKGCAKLSDCRRVPISDDSMIAP